MTASVSIIMPAYNLADYLEESINSVLEQTFPDFELIVINDSSTDKTAEVAEYLASCDSRMRVIHSDRNLGSAGARNLGLSASCAKYVAFLDGDDLWHPKKLEKQLSKISEHGVDLVYTAMQKIDADGRPFGAVQKVKDSVDYGALLRNPLIGCSTVLLDYDAVGRIGMPDIKKRQDFAFWLKLLRRGAVASGLNEPLTFYRVRAGSLSSNKCSAAHYTWQVYRRLEGLSVAQTIPCFSSYIVHAIAKRFNR